MNVYIYVHIFTYTFTYIYTYTYLYAYACAETEDTPLHRQTNKNKLQKFATHHVKIRKIETENKK